MISYAIYTNSEYFDVLRIHYEKAKTLFGKEWKLYVISDQIDPLLASEPIHWILYDNNTQYLGRLAFCLSQIPDEYVIVAHDVHVPIQVDSTNMHEVLSHLKLHGIRSIELKHLPYGPRGKKIYFNDSLELAQKTQDYIYSQQPTLYNRMGFLDLCKSFSHLGYREAERAETFEFARKHLNPYSLFAKSPMQSIYHRCSQMFVFVHITSRLKYVPYNPANTENLHPTVHDAHKQLSQQFSSSRGVQPSIYWFK